MNRRWLAPVYYFGLLALVVLIATGAMPTVKVFGVHITKQVSENSEGLVFALLLPLWVQFVRPRLEGASVQWPVTLMVSAACLATGALLYNEEGALGGLKTLNETVLALALLLPYVQLRRPLPAGLGILAAAAVVVLVIAFSSTSVVTRLAEGVGMLVLAPLTFDVVDRALLNRSARGSTGVRVTWYSLLVLLPAAFSLLNRTVDGGPVEDFLAYAVRTQEAFVGMLLAGLYLALAAGDAHLAGAGRRAQGPLGGRAAAPRSRR